MQLTTKHYVVLAALLTAVGLHIGGAATYHDLLAPKMMGELLFTIGSTLSALFMRSPSDTAEKSGRETISPDRLARLGLVLLLVGAAAWATACGNTVRHFAVVTDNGFAQAVFSADDQWAAVCHLDPKVKAPTPLWCAEADPLLKKALTDVGIVTTALQATPKDALTLPKGLPDLVGDLVKVQGVVLPLKAADGQAGALASKVSAALDKALALLNSFAGK